MLTCVEVKDLTHIARLGIPHDRGLVHTAAEQQVSLLVPLERKDRALVFVQRLFELAWKRT